jgi:hypothetical protein
MMKSRRNKTRPFDQAATHPFLTLNLLPIMGSCTRLHFERKTKSGKNSACPDEVTMLQALRAKQIGILP